jgi:cytochrome c-type biogenesis protein CcsB
VLAPDLLAPLGDRLMVSATGVYAIALVGYAAQAAYGVRGRVGRTLAVPVGVGAEHPAGGGGEVPAETVHRGKADVVGRVAVALTVLGFALQLIATVARGLAAGRAPWGNLYEFATGSALATVGVFLVLLARRDVRHLGTLVLLPVVLGMGLALTVFYAASGPLIPALNSSWLAIHVTAAVVSSGIFTVATAATVLYLFADAADRRVRAGRRPGTLAGIARGLASPEALDRTAYRTVAFGFPLWTFAVIAGAIWAEAAWSRYWGWDPKETWAFITWVLYAGYLHARATAGWRGRAAAWIALAAFAAFLFNLFGVNIWITGLHSYAGV